MLSSLFLFHAIVVAQGLKLVPFAQNLTAPTDIENAGDGSGRLFVLEQAGTVRILRDGTAAGAPFLDISSRLSTGGERGLLGIAFPPKFSQSQRFYVDYTNTNGDTVIAQYRVSSNPDVADFGSERILLTIAQPFANHNGGGLHFGPDGYLYIGMGDGGGSGDPMGNAQNLGSLLGKILRIDVESAPGEVRIPADNPFVNQAGARAEVWAYGLRNPWRFSFDPANGDLWIADVGQSAWEEIDYQPASSKGGQNYGWPKLEGTHCYNSTVCPSDNVTLPVAEYGHDNNACSITGGYVYRGSAWPGMRGLFLYGDYCSGRISAISRSAGTFESSALLDTDLFVTTFGQDEAGELYVASSRQSALYKLQGDSAPRFVQTDVVNSASFGPEMTAGSLATVFVAGIRDAPGITAASGVPLPLSLDGVSVTVGGQAAPILALANVNGMEQVNFQIPFEMAPRSSVDVTVSRAGKGSSTQTIPLRTSSPAIYASGDRAVVVHNTSFALVTDQNPAQPGEEVFLYASGLGAVTNAPSTGGAAPGLPAALVRDSVQVTVDGLGAEVTFAGLAPGYVGVYQVNFKIPAGTGSGLKIVALGGSSRTPVLQLPVK